MTFSTTLLGSLVITSDICRIGKLPKKARGLITYLAAQRGQPVSRERLADLLWPYQGSEQARHSLRNCLLELRRALGLAAARHLVAGFTSCQLRDVEIDLDEFERLSRSQQRSDLQAAADLYRNEFLTDFHIASEPFQEWLAAERDRTLAIACDVLHRLAAAQGTSGNHDSDVQAGRRLVALDPLSEIGQRALIRAYAQAGRRGEALRQYKSCIETLQRELGVTPDAETQSLADEIARRGNVEEPVAGARAAGTRTPIMVSVTARRSLESRSVRESGAFAAAAEKAAVALPAAENCSSGGSDAQPDRRCRPPNLGGSIHRRSSHGPPAPWPRSLPQTLGRGARRTRKTFPAAASSKRILLPCHRRCATERSGEVAGQYEDQRGG